MNIEGFNRLLYVLRNVASDAQKRKAFSLHDWVDSYIPSEEYHKDQDMLMIPHNCETTACACGYAGLDGWFRERGFITAIDGNLYYQNKNKEEYYGWEAVEAFFGIDEETSWSLFLHDSYKSDECTEEEFSAEVTVEEVIAKIENFLKENQVCQLTQCV